MLISYYFKPSPYSRETQVRTHWHYCLRYTEKQNVTFNTCILEHGQYCRISSRVKGLAFLCKGLALFQNRFPQIQGCSSSCVPLLFWADNNK